MDDDERERLLAEAMRQPLETRNQRDRRLIEERNAEWAAKRVKRETTMTQAMASLEARLNAKHGRLVDHECGFVLKSVGEAFKVFYDESIVKQICEPYEKKFAELQASVDSLRAELDRLRTEQRAHSTGNDEVIDVPPLPWRRHAAA